MRCLPLVIAALLLASLLGLRPMASHAASESAPGDVPVNLSADEVTYDRELGIITASGNVEITQQDRTLLADTVTYNQRQNLVTASGNVTLLEPTGDVLFGEYMELTDDFRDGIVRNLRMILKDRSRVAAVGARRSSGTRLDMAKAVYSACEPCKDNPDRPPIWQVKAVRVLHDSERQTVEYKDAWMELFGVPVAYTPYLSHPDPTVRRRSGFLTPGFGGSNFLGAFVRIPYFIDIAPNKDATITPIITTQERAALVGEYRQRLETSELKAQLSGTYDSNDDFRGHVDAKGRFDLNETWRWGFDARRTTDDLYLRQYKFGFDPTLTSRVFAEGFRGRNYLVTNAYAFQGLRADDKPGQAPLVIPFVEYSHVGQPGVAGGHTRLDASLLSLTRTDGADTRRLSLKPGWELPYIGPMGDVYKLSLSTQADLYHVNDQLRSGEPNSFNGATGRVVPQAALDWRFPFVNRHGTTHQILEPVTSFVVSPYGGNPDKIPNEDSQSAEFDDTNLFKPNRFSGVDRVDGGPRVNYGLKWGVYGDKGGSTTAFVGQSYRLREDDTFARGSGLEDNLSDYVARVNITPGRYVNVQYRTRLDKENFSPRRNEARATIGTPALQVATNYSFFDTVTGGEFQEREELTLGVSSRISRLWRANFSMTRDLQDSGTRNLALNFVYEDECLVFTVALQRHFFRDRDLEPDDSILLRLNFKTLGEVFTSIAANP